LWLDLLDVNLERLGAETFVGGAMAGPLGALLPHMHASQFTKFLILLKASNAAWSHGWRAQGPSVGVGVGVELL
jgi:hypothetical protein